MRTGAPVPRRSASANSSLFPLCRPGEVTRISIRSQPSRLARRVCVRASVDRLGAFLGSDVAVALDFLAEPELAPFLVHGSDTGPVGHGNE